MGSSLWRPGQPLTASRGGAGGSYNSQRISRCPRRLRTRTGTAAGIRAATAAIAAITAATEARGATAAENTFPT